MTRPRRPTGRRSLPRDLVAIAMLGLVYYGAARFSLLVAVVGENVTPLWPPTGIAVVALFVDRRAWAGIFAAAFAVNVSIESPLAALATAAGNTIAPLLAAELLRAMDFRVALDRVRDAVALVVAALAPMIVSATTGAGALVLTSDAPGGFVGAWSAWWAGDAMGVLIVTPFLLVLPRMPSLAARGWPRAIEGAALVVALGAVCWVVMTSTLSLAFLVLPLVGWSAWRFQQPVAAVAAAIVSGFATWAAVTNQGPFATGRLLEDMLTLQAFNAATAFTSLFFAALVTERNRGRDVLERAAADLEEQVERRTAELRRNERLLAEAQEVARLGSWRWDVRTGHVQWSDEMFRIHGHPPGSFPVTFDRAIEQVLEPDRPTVRTNVERALERGGPDVSDVEYRIQRPDGAVRILVGRARVSRGPDGNAVTMVGTIQDVTDRRTSEREHVIADTLQRALMPHELPSIPGVELAARYLAAETHAYAGGDWYDVIRLDESSIALVIGDAAGHGIEAATVMGQIRTAVRAYAFEGLGPGEVVSRTDALLLELGRDDLVTLVYLAIDVTAGVARMVNAGHPPPLLLSPGRPAVYLRTPVDLPLGLGLGGEFREVELRLDAGTALLLYTDGLIDRRDLDVDEGLERLLRAAQPDGDASIEGLCDRALATLAAGDATDDVAILGCRVPGADARFSMRIEGAAEALAGVRRRLAEWVHAWAGDAAAVDDIVLACSEACANAVEHAYGLEPGVIEIDGTRSDSEIALLVRDFGTWREPGQTGRGRGLSIMRACMDSVVVDVRADGTDVRMRRRLRDPA